MVPAAALWPFLSRVTASSIMQNTLFTDVGSWPFFFSLKDLPMPFSVLKEIWGPLHLLG